MTRAPQAFSRDAIDSASAGEWRSVRLNVNYVQVRRRPSAKTRAARRKRPLPDLGARAHGRRLLTRAPSPPSLAPPHSPVQDLFLNAAALIQGLLLKEGAHVYVCGDGRSMAADVHSELLAVLQLDCGGGRPASSAAEADALLAQLAAAGRYTREIWY